MDVVLLDFESRPGYFRDRYGRWQPERRQNPDRRIGKPVSAEEQAMRRHVRRASDRDALEYVATAV